MGGEEKQMDVNIRPLNEFLAVKEPDHVATLRIKKLILLDGVDVTIAENAMTWPLNENSMVQSMKGYVKVL